VKTNAAVHELVTRSSTGLSISTPGVIVAPAAGAACAGLPTSANATTAMPSTATRRKTTDHSP
jgi:hypothetical protein